MTINLIIYGIYKSIKERRNMFPSIMNDIEIKANVFGNKSVFMRLDDEDED
ncbi:hypothetical protein OX283_002735 [Flavobacterium sp. SUN052]|uniref:hypothetical protein n=1 Tax=Flavobacterium sp. SUN052 TaxID=3002441 RepID=UPI00237DABDC|nr:hypothetical protein [Flavobacterium sp. SUN052]MEC4003562.1 hypothetical protein [Flavobacterium sp. SUN052]